MTTEANEHCMSMVEADEELDALLARADAELVGAGAGEGVPWGELDDRALERRTESFLRNRRSEEDLNAVSERFAPAAAALDPPTRFVRRGREIRLPPVGPGQRPEQHAQLDRIEPEPERRSLIVSSVYPSGRAATPQARIVRWSRKRKAPGDGAGETGPRGERAKAFVGAVAYI
jgi:hypothetical protein